MINNTLGIDPGDLFFTPMLLNILFTSIVVEQAFSTIFYIIIFVFIKNYLINNKSQNFSHNKSSSYTLVEAKRFLLLFVMSCYIIIFHYKINLSDSTQRELVINVAMEFDFGDHHCANINKNSKVLLLSKPNGFVLVQGDSGKFHYKKCQ